MDYVNKRLSNTEARGIANILLKVFGIMYKAVQMKYTSIVVGSKQKITRVFCYPYDEVERVEKKQVDYKDFNQNHLNNVYELFWRRRKYIITLYRSPEECGYFSILPDYEKVPYTFCIIQEKKILSEETVNEICFGFDSEKGNFLELFDIDLHQDGTIYSAEDSIESELKGRIVF